MRILLVDDHEMVRLGLKSYFDLQDDVEVVGEAANGSQGIDLGMGIASGCYCHGYCYA